MAGKQSVIHHIPATTKSILIKEPPSAVTPTFVNQTDQHENIKLILFFLTSLVGGVIFYFK